MTRRPPRSTRKESSAASDVYKRQIFNPVTIPLEIEPTDNIPVSGGASAVSYTHLRAHETRHDLVCRLLLEKKKPTY
ncbi:hypothetical protein CDFC105_43986 [Clostridioides difficile]|nr:hypothetical protein CDFC105_43986 [Clostridioides difficile]